MTSCQCCRLASIQKQQVVQEIIVAEASQNSTNSKMHTVSLFMFFFPKTSFGKNDTGQYLAKMNFSLWYLKILLIQNKLVFLIAYHLIFSQPINFRLTHLRTCIPTLYLIQQKHFNSVGTWIKDLFKHFSSVQNSGKSSW